MIKIEHLSKHFRVAQPGAGLSGKLKSLVAPRYRDIHAVDDVNLSIAQGEIVGYLGPNGAGKSTTIKILTGVLVPSAGKVTVNGLVPYQNRVRNAYQIGVVYGQRSQLWWDLPLLDSFEILSAMYKVPQLRYQSQLAFLVDLLQMKEFIDQPVRKLSLGQRMKGDIVAALLHEPPILYLDEPTIGLDVVSKNSILRFLSELNAAKQTTILLTTHNLADVERFCRRIVIIDKGKVILDDSPEAILRQFGQRRLLRVEFDAEAPHLDLTVGHGRVVRREANAVWIEFDRDEISGFDLISSLDKNSGIRDVSLQDATIETIVTKIYEDSAGVAAAP